MPCYEDAEADLGTGSVMFLGAIGLALGYSYASSNGRRAFLVTEPIHETSTARVSAPAPDFTSPPERGAPSRRALIGLVARIALTCIVFAVLLTKVDIAAVRTSLLRLPAWALLGSFASLAGAVASGIVRWRLLLSAYGASVRPGWLDLARRYLVAMFYNLLPSAIGGDVYRGIATRHYFADGAITRSVGVVLVERVLGLSGLLLLAASASLTSPQLREQVLVYAALGLAAASGVIAMLSIGQRMTPYLPRPARKLSASLPNIVAPTPFAVAVLTSVISHLFVTLAGYVLIVSLAPALRLTQAMVIFPLGALAAYFPITFAGAGARDVALIFLLAQVGVARNDALATSLCLLVFQLSLAALGGLFQTARPAVAPSAVDSSSALPPRDR
jgi:uncharacterized membrane protein YbhN (UPF0104 family)